MKLTINPARPKLDLIWSNQNKIGILEIFKLSVCAYFKNTNVVDFVDWKYKNQCYIQLCRAENGNIFIFKLSMYSYPFCNAFRF